MLSETSQEQDLEFVESSGLANDFKKKNNLVVEKHSSCYDDSFREEHFQMGVASNCFDFASSLSFLKKNVIVQVLLYHQEMSS